MHLPTPTLFTALSLSLLTHAFPFALPESLLHLSKRDTTPFWPALTDLTADPGFGCNPVGRAGNLYLDTTCLAGTQVGDGTLTTVTIWDYLCRRLAMASDQVPGANALMLTPTLKYNPTVILTGNKANGQDKTAPMTVMYNGVAIKNSELTPVFCWNPVSLNKPGIQTGGTYCLQAFKCG